MEIQVIEDVSSEMFTSTVAGVLSGLHTESPEFAGAISKVASDALTVSITPGISPFRLPGPARGLGQLLHGAKLRDDYRVYERVRREVQGAEADRLLSQAYTSTWPELRLAYCVPVARWSSDRSDYRQVEVARLPPPHNLQRGCNCAHRYEEFEQQCSISQRTLWARLSGQPADPHRVRAEAWLLFQDSLRSGNQGACELHRLATPKVRGDAMEMVTGLIDNAPRWEESTVYVNLREINGVGEPLPPTERLAWSLLSEPVVWVPGVNALVNGQHRLCGAAAAGLERLWVQVQR